ncbi:MAG: hypothetical protein ACI8X5_001763 [Planctomycetota bacterium]|jgi:hypothetical protein
MQPRSTLIFLASLFLLGSLLFTSACNKAAPSPAEEGQGLVIQNPTNERAYFVDFGRVKNGKKVSHVFELKNTDSAPITIHDLTPSCSCSNPKIQFTDADGQVVRGKVHGSPIITIPPGVTAELTVTINTELVRVKNIDKLSAISLRCDSIPVPYMHLEMHLIATEPYQMTPRTISLGNIPISAGKQASSDFIAAIPGTGYRIIDVFKTSDGIDAQVVEKHTGVETLWTIVVNLLPPLEIGPFKGEVLLRTTGMYGEGEDEPIRLEVLGHVVPDVYMTPAILGFTPVLQGGDDVHALGELTALTPGHRIKIVDALLSGQLHPTMTLEYEAIAPDSEGYSSRWSVALRATGPLEEEYQTGSVQFTLADPNLEPVTVKFLWRRN